MTIESVFQSHDNPSVVTVSSTDSATPLLGVTRITCELVSAAILIDSDTLPLAITWTDTQIIFDIGDQEATGTQKAVIVAYDPAHTDGQVIAHPNGPTATHVSFKYIQNASIIVEDGTGIANSETYVTEQELADYAANRGITLTGVEAELLTTAMDYIESRPFKGGKNTAAQALQWPRNGVWVDGFRVDSASIPQLLKDAQMEAALATDAGNNPSGTVDRATKREKLEGLEVVYMDGAAATKTNRALNMKLSKLVLPGNRLIRT